MPVKIPIRFYPMKTFKGPPANPDDDDDESKKDVDDKAKDPMDYNEEDTERRDLEGESVDKPISEPSRKEVKERPPRRRLREEIHEEHPRKDRQETAEPTRRRKDSGERRHKDSEERRHKDSGERRHKDPEEKRRKDSGERRHKDSEEKRRKDSGERRRQDSGERRRKDSEERRPSKLDEAERKRERDTPVKHDKSAEDEPNYYRQIAKERQRMKEDHSDTSEKRKEKFESEAPFEPYERKPKEGSQDKFTEPEDKQESRPNSFQNELGKVRDAVIIKVLIKGPPQNETPAERKMRLDDRRQRKLFTQCITDCFATGGLVGSGIYTVCLWGIKATIVKNLKNRVVVTYPAAVASAVSFILMGRCFHICEEKHKPYN